MKKQSSGHRIELRKEKGKPVLLMDDRPLRYGQLPDGRYFLDDYAYDWSDDLMEVAERYAAYLKRVEKVRQRESRKEGGK